jgi:hypothetical protein
MAASSLRANGRTPAGEVLLELRELGADHAHLRAHARGVDGERALCLRDRVPEVALEGVELREHPEQPGRGLVERQATAGGREGLGAPLRGLGARARRQGLQAGRLDP